MLARKKRRPPARQAGPRQVRGQWAAGLRRAGAPHPAMTVLGRHAASVLSTVTAHLLFYRHGRGTPFPARVAAALPASPLPRRVLELAPWLPWR